MNKLEKIFSLIIKFGDSEKKIPEIGKLLQSLNARLQNVLQTIREIGQAQGIKQVADAVKVYDVVAREADNTRKKAVNTSQREKEQNEAAAKAYATLLRECKNLVFTKKEIASISKNFITLQNSEKQSVESLYAQINILTIAWKKMGAEQRNSVAGKQVTADLKAMREQVRGLTMGAGDTSRNIGNYVSGIYNAFTSQIAVVTTAIYTVKRALQGIFKPFQDLEYRMSMVRAVSQATDEEFIALEQNARDLGATTEYTATEVAGLQLAYARMGFVPDQIIKITGATLDLATATGEDLAKSADVVGTTLRGFNLEAEQTQRVVDVMTQAFNGSSLQLDSFYESMKYVAPIASVANVSLEQTSAMLGVLADRGIRGSQAGTALRRIFTEMAKEGGSVTERLDQLSKKGLTLGGAMDEVGRYAMTALTVLSKSKDSVDNLTVSLDNSAGAAKKAADIMRDNMKGDMDKFLSAAQEKLISIGEFLSPLARGVMQMGTTFVTSLKEITWAVALSAAGVAIWNLRIKAKIAWGQLSALSDKASAIATALNTASLSGNTVALIRNSVAVQGASVMTKAYAVAKLLLTGNIKAATVAIRVFTAAIAKNPLGLLAVALASVVSYFVFFRQKADGATSAQKRFNDENDRFNKAQDEKRQRIEALIGVIKDETETELAKARAYEELQRLSPALTAKYTQEQIATLALADSTRLLNEVRDKEYYDKQKGKLDRLVEVYKQLTNAHGNWNKAKLTDEERSKYNGQTTENALKDVQRDIDIYKQNLNEIEAARRQAEENAKPIKIRIEIAEGNVEQLKKELRLLNAEKEAWIKEHGTAIAMPIAFKLNVIKTEKDLAEAKKKAAALKEDPNPSGGGGEDKGEWSLSKDKEHSRQLLDLKKQLFSGEIASEEVYQKQVLQLEIDTLTKRIALNKDGAVVTAKLGQELLDKQIQQKKASQKENETLDARDRAAENSRLKFENDCRRAEINTMKDGLEKKLLLSEQSQKETIENAAREHQTKMAQLSKDQESYTKGSALWQAAEDEKSTLSGRYQTIITNLASAGEQDRIKILRDATEEELNEYAKVPGKAFEAEAAITENKRREVEDRLKLSKKELAGADNKFIQNEIVADSTYGTDSKDKNRHAARLKNEIELRQAKAQTYLADLEAMQKDGQTESAAYAQTLSNIGLLKKEAENLGKGLNADGSGGGVKGWLMRTFEVTEEEAKQLIQQAWDLASQIGNAMIDAQKQASQRRLKNEKKAIDSEYKIHSKLLDDKRDKGLISEKTYQKEMEKLEADKAAKEEAAEKAAFERQKKLSIQQAIMNTAIAVMKIWAETPKVDFGISTGILTALAIAQGAIQIATISSQKYAQGGLISLGDGMGVVKGRSHAQGGHRIYLDGRPIGEIEGDELLAIVNKRDTARIGALSAANSVHGRKFARGGLISPGGYMTSNVGAPAGFAAAQGQSWAELYKQQEADRQQRDITTQLLLDNIEAINRRIDTLKVVVVAQDVTDTQDNIKKIRVKSSW